MTRPKRAPRAPTVSPARQPVQARSQRTLEALVRAAETLLNARDWSDIGIQEICKRARCTTGAFYARFKAKDELLPYLYARYDADLLPRWRAAFESQRWEELSLRDVTTQAAALVVTGYRERRPLLRAIALFARQHPESIGPEVRARRAELHDLPLAAFARYHPVITHPNPEVAVRTGLFIILAAARDKILFEDAPHASVTPISDASLITELSRALFAYLTI